ncbi:hypothetical protein GCM10027456_71520 [Kineosporia babensis]
MIVAGLVLTPLTSTTALAVPPEVVESGAADVTTAAADCNFTPRSVVLKGRPKSLKFSVPEATDWNVRIPDANVDAAPGRRVKTFYPKDFANSDAGLHQATVSRGTESCASNFRLRRGSLLTLLVTHKHPYRFVGGSVQRFNLGPKGGRSFLPGARVELQRWTKDGWVTHRMLTTNKKGIFVTRLKIGKRAWRAKFTSTSTTQGSVSRTARNESEL